MESKPSDLISEFEMSVCLTEGENSPDVTPQDRITHRTQARQEAYQSNAVSDQLMNFREEMRKLLSYFTASQKKELSDLKATLMDVRQSNQNIEGSVAFLAAQNEELKKQVNSLDTQIKEDRQYIIYLENKIEDMQLLSRKANLEIKNVPKKEKETKQDLVNMVIALSETLDHKVTKSEIRDIYRVRGKKPEQNSTPIIVEINSALLKNDILRMAKTYNSRNKVKLCAKHLGLKIHEDTPIFLSENLTAKGSRLHYLARDLAKSKEYRFCWTAYGKVYVRRSENSPIILIRSEEQVHRLMMDD